MGASTNRKLELQLASNSTEWEAELGKAGKAVEELANRAGAAGLSLDQGFEKQVEESDKAIRALILTAQQSDKIQISPQAARSVAALRVQLVQAKGDFQTFSKGVTQDSATFTRGIRRSNAAVSQLVFGVQDFVQVLSQPGFGFAGAVRASSNNLQQFLALAAPGGIGVILGLGAAFLPAIAGMINFGDASETTEGKLEKFEGRLESIDKRIRSGARLGDLIDAGDVDAVRTSIEGLDTDLDVLNAKIELTKKQIEGSRKKTFAGGGFQAPAIDIGLQDTSETTALRESLKELQDELRKATEGREQAQGALPLAQQNSDPETPEQKSQKQQKTLALEFGKQVGSILKDFFSEVDKAARERQKRVDAISRQMVSTLRDVIDADGDLEQATDDLRKLFTDLGNAAADVALKQASQQAQQDDKRTQGLRTITAARPSSNRPLGRRSSSSVRGTWSKPRPRPKVA